MLNRKGRKPKSTLELTRKTNTVSLKWEISAAAWSWSRQNCKGEVLIYRYVYCMALFMFTVFFFLLWLQCLELFHVSWFTLLSHLFNMTWNQQQQKPDSGSRISALVSNLLDKLVTLLMETLSCLTAPSLKKPTGKRHLKLDLGHVRSKKIERESQRRRADLNDSFNNYQLFFWSLICI